MGYWAEIRNDYFCTDFGPSEGDALASVSIDAWKTMDDNEEGRVIARVILSKQGDILVDYHDNVARGDEAAQTAISEATEQLKAHWKEQQMSVDAKIEKGVVSLGASAFVAWQNIDVAVCRWAKGYFGDHVMSIGSRDNTDFLIELRGLKDSDFETFLKLYQTYDKEHDYEPEFDFAVAPVSVELPACISCALMREALGEKLPAYGTAVASYDGVFFMEKAVEKERSSEKTSLDTQILTAQAQVKPESEPGISTAKDVVR